MNPHDHRREVPGLYAEHAPPSALAAGIARIWTSEPDPVASPGATATRTHLVLPDGCMDIVIRLAPDAGPGEEEIVAVGTMTRPLIVEDTTVARYVGIRFRPGAAPSALRVEADALTDNRVPLVDLWPDVTALLDAAHAATSPADRARRVAAAIAPRLHSLETPLVVSRALALIDEARGAVSITQLCSALGVTRQHLARVFAREVGVGPKRFARIVRARWVLARIRGVPSPAWATLAFEHGYADQSHMIADVRMLTGTSPTRWTARLEREVPFLL